MPQTRSLTNPLKQSIVGLGRWLLTLGVVGGIGIIPIRLALTQHQVPQPQAILVLEGNTDRVKFAAQFAQLHPQLPIWVSGNPGRLKLNRRIFKQAGIPAQQVRYDFCATDTVTNFTCNVRDFRTQNIRHVYLITSKHHMPRSQAIATFVLGSHGIVATPIPVDSGDTPSESIFRILRDCIRSVIWMATGWTSANLNPELWR